MAALALGGCTAGTGGPGPAASPPATSTTTAPPSASPPPAASSPAPTAKASAPRADDAIASGTLANARCVDQGGGSWRFTGAAHNGSGRPLTLTIAVAVTSGSGALVVAHASFSETLAPGESRDVSLPLSAESSASADCTFVASQEVAP